MAASKTEVLQGTLDLLVLKTLDSMGPMHGFGIALRIHRFPMIFFKSTRELFIPRCFAWNNADGSHRSGEPRKIIARRSFIR